jgi:hypothetical protein
MLPTERESGRQNTEAGDDRTLPLGALSDVIVSLHPSVSEHTAGEAEVFCSGIQEFTGTIASGQEDRLMIRGSTAKRGIYRYFSGMNEPPGWRTPGKIWAQLAEYFPASSGLFDPVGLFVHRRAEMDMAYEPVSDSAAKIGDFMREYAAGRRDLTVHNFSYAGIDLFDITWIKEAFTIQIHSLPHGASWNIESRTSGNLPVNEWRPGLLVRGKDVTIQDTAFAELCSSKVTGGTGGTLEQSIIGFQRLRMNLFWYRETIRPELVPEEVFYGVRSSIRYEKPDIWRFSKDLSLKNPKLFQDRTAEIVANNLFLLTIDPASLTDSLYRNLYISTPILARIGDTGFTVAADYEQKFRNGMLTLDESGPMLAARHLGLGSPADLIPLVTPSLDAVLE